MSDQNEIYSKVVRAGKRTYFFDIKATKGNDLYITLTESKKSFGEDGADNYQQHKIFLYKEDFEKFSDGLVEAIDFIKNNSPVVETVEQSSDISFEDLGQ